MGLQKDYVETLQGYLLPFCTREALGRFGISSRWAIHTSILLMSWMENVGVQVLPLSARSPDLNPVKNFWVILFRIVYEIGKHISTLYELKVKMEDE